MQRNIAPRRLHGLDLDINHQGQDRAGCPGDSRAPFAREDDRYKKICCRDQDATDQQIHPEKGESLPSVDFRSGETRSLRHCTLRDLEASARDQNHVFGIQGYERRDEPVTRVACRRPRIRPRASNVRLPLLTLRWLCGNGYFVRVAGLFWQLVGVELKAAICTGIVLVGNHWRLRGEKKLQGTKPNNEII